MGGERSTFEEMRSA